MWQKDAFLVAVSWQKDAFLIDYLYFKITTSDGIIPVEVKSSDNFRAKSLKVYMQKFSPKYAIRLSARNFGIDNEIKSVPLYATFCIKDSSF